MIELNQYLFILYNYSIHHTIINLQHCNLQFIVQDMLKTVNPVGGRWNVSDRILGHNVHQSDSAVF
jgi:hypothetical protein